MFAQTKGKSSNHVLIQLNYMASKSVYRLVNAVKLLNPTGKKIQKDRSQVAYGTPKTWKH